MLYSIVIKVRLAPKYISTQIKYVKELHHDPVEPFTTAVLSRGSTMFTLIGSRLACLILNTTFDDDDDDLILNKK